MIINLNELIIGELVIREYKSELRELIRGLKELTRELRE